MNELSQALIKLYQNERFYAELLLQMDRIVSTRIPTAGVCVKDRIQLHVNPEYFKSLSIDTRVAILKHECEHIYFDHISRAKELCPEIYNKKDNDIADVLLNSAKHQVINIAADCAINPGIPDVPVEGMFPAKFSLPDGRTMEWYVENLKNNDKLKVMGEGFDEHSLWAESEGEKEELKEKIKQAVNAAAKATRDAGKMTNDIEALIDRLNYVPRDWKSDLRRFVARNQEVKIKTSRKKRNRRYGILYPGVIKEEVLHIGVAVDTSGSISDEALNQFFAEIAQIAKYAKVTVVEADTEVKQGYVFNPKKVYKALGRGGTAYQPAFDYFTDETDVDGVIYFGDMDCYDTSELKKPKYSVLWAIVGNQKPPASWGSQTKVEIKNRK